jgi:hypothetical protein
MNEAPMVWKGVVHGKIIELEQATGLPEGQVVTVTIEPLAVPTDALHRWEEARADVTSLPPGEGIRRSAGGWAEDAEELDQFLEWVRQQRKVGRRGLEP